MTIPFAEEAIPATTAILHVLKDAGIEFVFGVPAGNSTRIYSALFDFPGVRAILVREESLAGVMAEVYGRLTGRPGVVLGQSAFLITNALLGVMEAHVSSAPMLLLADLSDDPPYAHHGPYQAGTGAYGAFDARSILGGLTKSVAVAHGAAQFVQLTQRAIRHAVDGNPGPTAVLFGAREVAEDVGPGSRPLLYRDPIEDPPSRGPLVDPGAIEAAAALLSASGRPLLLAGNGVRISGAYAALKRTAELLGAPVVTTAGGKGVFDEFHPLALGPFGNFGTTQANEALAEADTVLVVGSRLGPTDTANEHRALLDPARHHLIQVDVEPRNLAWTYPMEVAVLGDASDALSALEARLARNASANRAPWYDKQSDPSVDARPSPTPAGLDPRDVIDELTHLVPADSLVCCDAGENRIFMSHYFRSRGQGRFLQPSGTGGMGYAIPAALAGSLVYPGQRAIAVCGDGGFGMSMNGLLTAVELGLPIVVVVFNNASLGWVRHGQGDRPVASDLGDFDYAAIGAAMGCIGHRVSTREEFSLAFRDALSARRPAVIDVAVSMELTFRDVTSPLVGQSAEDSSRQS